MTERSWLARLCLTGMALSAGAGLRAAEPIARNVILIMADDLGYGDLSCYGGEAFETPHLDALAAEGMRFIDFHSNGNVCSPTRAALLTGRYPHRAGIDDVIFANPSASTHRHGLMPEEVTFAEVARDAGCATAIAGKWHLGYDPAFSPLANGFDSFVGYVSGNVDFHSHIDGFGRHDWWRDRETDRRPGYTTTLITDAALDFIAAQRNLPFVLYVAHEAPHYPYQGPDDPPIRTEGQRGGDKYDGTGIDKKRAYREMVQEMDRGVGAIIERLRELDLADSTLVLFFSDNGAVKLGSNGDLRGHKGAHWEGGHRVPCIAWMPGHIPAGSVIDTPAMTMDIFPTIADALGAPIPGDLDGASLLPVLTRTASQPPRDLFWSRRGETAVRRGPWKLITRLDDEGAAPFLANLENDPAESTNLAAAHPDVTAELETAAAAWLKVVQTRRRAGCLRARSR